MPVVVSVPRIKGRRRVMLIVFVVKGYQSKLYIKIGNFYIW